MIITYKVSVNEANLIVTALGKLPYETVNELITRLTEEGNSQIAKQQSSSSQE